MLMMTLFNAPEREKDEWIGLLRNADVRFRFVDAKMPEVDTMSFIPANWRISSQRFEA